MEANQRSEARAIHMFYIAKVDNDNDRCESRDLLPTALLINPAIFYNG
jgi:hypothetical protein